MVTIDSRPALLPLELKQLVTTNANKLSRFQFQPFIPQPGTSSDYASWWPSVFHKAFPHPSDYYLSKLVGSGQSRLANPPRPVTTKAVPSTGTKPSAKSTLLTSQGKHR